MRILNQFLTTLFDLVMWPCQVASPWPGLVAASLLTAFVLVGLFKLTSNPQKILQARNRFLARTLELLLFQHDLRVSLTACGRILAANGVYLVQFLVPMLIGLVPLVLIFIQMEAWFDRRPLDVGEATVLTVQLDAAHPVVSTPVKLTLPETIRLDSPPVRTPTKNEVAWRLVAVDSGRAAAEVKIGETSETKSLVVDPRVVRVSPRRESSGWITPLFAPSEPPLSTSSPIRRIEVAYPPRVLELGDTEVSWIVAAVVLMLVFSLIVGAAFGVRIA